MAKYLSIQYPNNKPANQRNGKKGDSKNEDDLKYKDKTSNMGDTAGAHVEYTTITKESTAPSRGASTGAYILETSEQSSCPSLTIVENSEAHSMNDDNFWGDTKHNDASIDTANSKEM